MVDAGERDESAIPGNRAIWVGIFAELTEFALMFLVYFIIRAHHPAAVAEGSSRLSSLAGVAITLVMLTSSFFVARGVVEIRCDRRRAALGWLAAALVAAVAYPVIKFFEVRWNLSRGLDGSGDVFQLAYYYLTFNHLVHVSWGILGLLWVMVRTGNGGYTAGEHRGIIAFASYWHATDMIWLMIFPLFYLLH